MKNYQLIALVATTLLGACKMEGPKDRYDESENTKVRTDFYENDRLEKSVYYKDGKESKTVYFEYKGKKLTAVRSQTADGKLAYEYKITPTERIERKVAAVDGQALQIVNYDVNGKVRKLETLRRNGRVNCHMRYGITGKLLDSLSAYIRYSYDPKTDQLNLYQINFADIEAEKSQHHDNLKVGIIPGALGYYAANWEDGFPQPIYDGPFRSSLSIKLPKGIFKQGIASIYVYAGKAQDRFWSQGTEQWIQLRLDEAYKGYNWYLLE